MTEKHQNSELRIVFLKGITAGFLIGFGSAMAMISIGRLLAG